MIQKRFNLNCDLWHSIEFQAFWEMKYNLWDKNRTDLFCLSLLSLRPGMIQVRGLWP